MGEPVDEAALDEVVRFTSELIRIDTTNFGGGDGNERKAAEYAAEKLAEVGVEARILEKAPNRSNVVARIEGTDPDADALLVHGHLDVVPGRGRGLERPSVLGRDPRRDALGPRRDRHEEHGRDGPRAVRAWARVRGQAAAADRGGVHRR